MLSTRVCDYPYLITIVLLSEKIVFGPIVGRSCSWCVTIDLWGEEILDTGTGGAVQDIVRRVLVAPSGAHVRFSCNLKDRVDFQVLIRVHWFAGKRVDL